MWTMLKIAFILSLMCFVALSEQQAVFTPTIHNFPGQSGPLTKIICEPTFPVGTSNHTIIWEFNGQQLAVNGTWKAEPNGRLSVEHNELVKEEWKSISILNIYNTTKRDEGYYTCLAIYYNRTSRYTNKKTIFVPMLNFLPPPGYPKCSASQSVFYEGHNVTFICDPGESNPPVDLKLILQGYDGNKTHLGNLPKVTAMMTPKNNHSRFVCHMTSATYAGFMRQCSLGPIVVLPPTETSSTVSIIIGCVVAGILVIVASIVIIICLVSRRSKTSDKSSNHPMDNVQSEEMAAPNPYTTTSITTESSNPTSNPDSSTQVYSEVDNKEIPNYEDAGPGTKSTSSASDQAKRSQDQASDKETDADHQIPVFAISSKPSESDNKSGGADKMTNDMPIYSQVNKDSGMVENMIYEPAGPM